MVMAVYVGLFFCLTLTSQSLILQLCQLVGFQCLIMYLFAFGMSCIGCPH